MARRSKSLDGEYAEVEKIAQAWSKLTGSPVHLSRKVLIKVIVTTFSDNPAPLKIHPNWERRIDEYQRRRQT